MVEYGDPIEYHEQAGDDILFVIADPDEDTAWIAAPEADSCPLDLCR